MKKLTIIASTTLLLSACGSGPSDSDIKTIAEKMAGSSRLLKVEVTDIDNTSCEEKENGIYKCTYEITAKVKNPIKGEETRTDTTTAMFKEGENGWYIVR